MYDCYRDGIADTRREEYSALGILGENLLHLSTWVCAGWVLWPVRLGGWPVLTGVWALLVVVIQILLKKHNCSGCYYYGKTCHLGWGRLASLLFAQDSGSLETGMRLSLFYVLSPPVVLGTGLAIGILMDVAMGHWMVLGAYVLLNVAVFPIRIVGCGSCAMRAVCPGSAVRKKAGTIREASGRRESS